jgi:hypothetical protein
MLKTLYRIITTGALTATVAVSAVSPASADNGQAMAGVVAGANSGIKAVMSQPAGGTVAQVPPVNQPPVGGSQALGLPTGFTYTADFSVAYPFGNVGTTGKAWLPGGFDAVAGYGFDPTFRVVANYYELQHYPVAFNSGTVPLYLQGFATPLTRVNLATINPQINATTKDRFFLLNFEKLFVVTKIQGRPLPIVVTPTYVARWSTIASSPTNDDRIPFVPNAPNGFPVTDVYTRTAQIWSVAFTLPFLKSPDFFGTFTLAPSWLVHPAGLNQTNHAQLYQILYVEYTPTTKTRFFFEPQASRDYLPLDVYPQHIFAYFLGASQRVGKYGFVQLILNSGGPSNNSPYGVTALTCQALPCSRNPVLPTIGGLKATQLQLQFGIGTPSVLQF